MGVCLPCYRRYLGRLLGPVQEEIGEGSSNGVGFRQIAYIMETPA